MNKRGMSPLVATLLLIAFAVALGVVIMNFGRAQVELEATCTIDVGMEFSVINNEEQVCLDREKDQLFFIVENGVNTKIQGLVVNIIGAQKAVTYDYSDALIEKAGTYLKYAPYDVADIGELRQIKIVPKVILYEEELICQEQAIILEKIRDCVK